MGGTKVLGVALHGEKVVADYRVPTPRGPAAILDAVVEVWRALEHAIPVPAAALGIGAPGLVDRDGVLRFAPNLPGVIGLPLRAGLRDRIGEIPVAVENDATCAGWGERVLGAARGADHAVLITLGTGIGGGIVCEGRLLRGVNGFAGEIGHTVVDPHGPPCPCGKRGCWERFASGSGLGRLARDAAHAGQAAHVVELAGGDPEAVRGEHVTRAAAAGDAEANAIMGRFAWWLALGLANLANTFDPEVLVLAGGLVEAGEVLLEPTRAAFGELVEAGEYRPPIPIVLAELGERAGAIGAADLAADVVEAR